MHQHLMDMQTPKTYRSARNCTVSGCKQWALRQAEGAVPHAGGFTVGHVVVLPQHTQHALLPVPAAELVPNDRVSVETGLDVSPLQALVACANDGHLVYDGRLAGLVLAGLPPGCNSRTLSACAARMYIPCQTSSRQTQSVSAIMLLAS